MFEIGWSELMLIGIVALIVIGPKELPSVLRTVGRTVTKLRRMAGEFQGQFQEALREADIADMRKEISDVTETARSTLATSEMFDPLRSIRDEIRNTVEGGSSRTAAPDTAASDTPPLDTSPLDIAAPEFPASLEAPVGSEAPADPSDPLRAIREEIQRTMAATDPAPASPLSAEPFRAFPASESKSAS